MPDTGVLLAEDEAMKAKFSNLFIPGGPGADDDLQRVKTWFGMPSSEREAVYPFITIDLIDVVFAADRAESMDQLYVDWWPSEAPTWEAYAEDHDLEVDEDRPYATAARFQPYDLYYQVSTHCRFVLQDRHLSSQLLHLDYMPLSRVGSLHVPADGTYRWLDTEGFARADYRDSAGKPVWRKVYTVKVSAHMSLSDPSNFEKVLQVATTINEVGDGGARLAQWEEPPA